MNLETILQDALIILTLAGAITVTGFAINRRTRVSIICAAISGFSFGLTLATYLLRKI